MDQLPIEVNFYVVALEMDEFIKMLADNGYTSQAITAKIQFDKQVSELNDRK